MGVSVGGVLRQWSAYFRRGSMAREMFDWQPSVRQNDTRRSYSRYPILREAGWLPTVVSLAHIGVVGTCDLAGGL